MRVESLSDVCVGRSSGRVQRSHASIADRRDQHGEQRDQNNGDKVAVGEFLRHAIERNRRDRLDENDAVENQIPKRERAAEPRRGRGRRGAVFHGCGYWIMEGLKLSILKRFYKGSMNGSILARHNRTNTLAVRFPTCAACCIRADNLL